MNQTHTFNPSAASSEKGVPLCDYVFMNLWGLPGSRASLSRRKRSDLRYRRFVHDVDPCTLEDGHAGDHVLTTMPRVERDKAPSVRASIDADLKD